MDFKTELNKIPIKKIHLPKIENPKISFILPVYERAHLIAECIESIRRQTVKDFELLIVDDGSSDNLEDLLKFYVTLDDRIGYIILSRNVGVANARNIGNQFARSPYICATDSDDLYFPNRAKLSIEVLDKGADIFYGSYWEADISGNLVKFHKATKINWKKFRMKHYVAAGFTLAYRKDRVLEVPYRKDLRYNDDYYLLLDFRSAGYKFSYTTKPLGKTRTQLEGISMQEALND